MTRFLFMTLLTLFAMSGCDKVDDAARIRAVCDELVLSAEKHAISEMFEHATADFVAHPGGRDEQAARQILFVTFRRYGTFDVVHPRFEIRLDREKRGATVSVPFTIIPEGSSTDDASFDSLVDDPTAWAEAVREAIGDPYYLKLTLRKTGDDWKVRRADVTTFNRSDGI